MARKGSVGSRAHRAALKAVREALERGEVPVEAPDLVRGVSGDFWVAPDGRVYVRPVEALSSGTARAQRVPDVQLVVVPGSSPAGEGPAGPEWLGLAPWTDDMSRLCHWQPADSSRLVIDEV
ncbi:hypothetical protein [Streptomyces sp. NPDC051776]|uniref:hypothetical protein n=1 Tax=Streptomyces sp. NPDC051776 TaxID=3155414 RepID=UPI0034325B41